MRPQPYHPGRLTMGLGHCDTDSVLRTCGAGSHRAARTIAGEVADWPDVAQPGARDSLTPRRVSPNDPGWWR